MISIIDKRGTGKTSKLFQLAQENNATILTINPHALQVKAKSLGFDNLDIIGLYDLDNDNFDLLKPVFVDNAENVLQCLLDNFYNIKMEGFTATLENE